MAKSLGFRKRFPHAGLFLIIAIILAIPFTVWSLNHVSTQTQQHAAYTYNCTLSPTWSDYPLANGSHSLTYRLTLKNNCPNRQWIRIYTSQIPSGWTYTLKMTNNANCPGTTTLCNGIFEGYQTRSVSLTVTRPLNARPGTHYFSIRAEELWHTYFTSSKTLRYIVQ